MTDMRATERLLEVIEEFVQAFDEMAKVPGDLERWTRVRRARRAIIDTIPELRRRGDTLVRRDDLIAVLRFYAHEPPSYFQQAEPGFARMVEGLDRLENAIGGKP